MPSHADPPTHPHPLTSAPPASWLVHLSDIHISKFGTPDVAPELLELGRSVLAGVRPQALVLTGDLVDAKSVKEGDAQQLQEWQVGRQSMAAFLSVSAAGAAMGCIWRRSVLAVLPVGMGAACSARTDPLSALHTPPHASTCAYCPYRCIGTRGSRWRQPPACQHLTYWSCGATTTCSTPYGDACRAVTAAATTATAS